MSAPGDWCTVRLVWDVTSAEAGHPVETLEQHTGVADALLYARAVLAGQVEEVERSRAAGARLVSIALRRPDEAGWYPIT